MPKTTLYLVLAQRWLPLQVVGFGLAHFQLPVRPPKSLSPPNVALTAFVFRQRQTKKQPPRASRLETPGSGTAAALMAN